MSGSHDLCISGDCFEMLQRTDAVIQVIPYVKVSENRLHLFGAFTVSSTTGVSMLVGSKSIS